MVSKDGHLEVTAPPERSWELTAVLAGEGIYVSELVPTDVSLERYFLEVTSGNEKANALGQE